MTSLGRKCRIFGLSKHGNLREMGFGRILGEKAKSVVLPG